MAQITFNQEHKLTIKEGTTLSEFLKEQHLLKEGVAVAIDEDIIKKQKARICKCSSYPGFFMICNDALNRL